MRSVSAPSGWPRRWGTSASSRTQSRRERRTWWPARRTTCFLREGATGRSPRPRTSPHPSSGPSSGRRGACTGELPTPRRALRTAVKLDGIHHVTAITADAQSNLDFYAGVLGLRLVKKSVNQDDTSVYHLFYADETGDPGSDITFFEYPGAAPGRAGAGMVHQIVWRVSTVEALDFWANRLTDKGYEPARLPDSVVFDDPE